MRRFWFCFALCFSWVIASCHANNLPVFPTVDTSSVTVSTTTAAIVEPFGFPVSSARPKIVSGFGKRPLQKLAHALAMTTLPDVEPHDGVDFAATPGAPVLAATSGKVLFAGFSKEYISRKIKKEKSRLVIVQREDGISTRYVHLNTITVRPQQKITMGDKLGTVSDSDEWLSPVLHFEVRNAVGKPENPLKYLPALPHHP